jgi:hypothetical protein
VQIIAHQDAALPRGSADFPIIYWVSKRIFIGYGNATTCSATPINGPLGAL